MNMKYVLLSKLVFMVSFMNCGLVLADKRHDWAALSEIKKARKGADCFADKSLKELKEMYFQELKKMSKCPEYDKLIESLKRKRRAKKKLDAVIESCDNGDQERCLQKDACVLEFAKATVLHKDIAAKELFDKPCCAASSERQMALLMCMARREYDAMKD